MTNYFQNARSSELSELLDDLNSMKFEVKKEAVKQVIASMTVGKDVSVLFANVVKCMETTSIEIKKLVYLYIINYAKTKPDLTLMAINTFRKDAHEINSPLLRSLAVRTMGCIRIEKITEYLCEALKDTVKDKEPYVRKTVATCIAKLFVTAPKTVKDQGYIKVLKDMLSDGNAMVVANAASSLQEISRLSGRKFCICSSTITQKLLFALNEANEWGQVYILEYLSNYKPVDSEESESIIERIMPRLAHSNPSVSLAAIKVVLKFIDYVTNTEKTKTYIKKLSAPLLTLLAREPEIEYIALRNINFILYKHPNIFDKVKEFFVRFNEPIYVKLEKIDALTRVANAITADQILTELKDYSNSMEVDFSRKAIKCIAIIGIKFEKSSKKAFDILLEFTSSNNSHAIEESIISLAEMLRKYPNKFQSSISSIVKSSKFVEPESRAAFTWIVGEYADIISEPNKLLAAYISNFLGESLQCQQQLLTAMVKLYLKKPDESEGKILDFFKMITEESDTPDIRDRCFMYWKLLSTDPEQAKNVVLSEKPAINEKEYICYDEAFVDYLIDNIATGASVYHKRIEEFLPKEETIVLSDDDEEVKETAKPTEIPKKQIVPLMEPKDTKEKVVAPKKQETLLVDLDFNQDADQTSLQGGLLFDVSSPSPIDPSFFNENGYIIPTDTIKTGAFSISAGAYRSKENVCIKLYISGDGQIANPTIDFAKNSFSLNTAKKELESLKCPAKYIISCIVDPSKALTTTPPSCPFKLGMHLKCSQFEADIPVPVLVHTLFTENGRLNKDQFKQYWGMPKSNELVFESNVSAQLTTDYIKERLEFANIFMTGQSSKPGAEYKMLYFSATTMNSIPIVLEAAYPQSTENKVRFTIKAAATPLNPLLKECIQYILKLKDN